MRENAAFLLGALGIGIGLLLLIALFAWLIMKANS